MSPISLKWQVQFIRFKENVYGIPKPESSQSGWQEFFRAEMAPSQLKTDDRAGKAAPSASSPRHSSRNLASAKPLTTSCTQVTARLWESSEGSGVGGPAPSSVLATFEWFLAQTYHRSRWVGPAVLLHFWSTTQGYSITKGGKHFEKLISGKYWWFHLGKWCRIILFHKHLLFSAFVHSNGFMTDFYMREHI